MPYTATVLRIMIASPSDVAAERSIARDVIYQWNAMHSSRREIVLLPIGWETHSIPDLSAPPQTLINERVLKDCDILIGIFWSRLGTPTASASSGSAEEIERHVKENKHALLYFSEKAIDQKILDTDQYNALMNFRDSYKPRGIIRPYSDEQSFRQTLSADLEILIYDYHDNDKISLTKIQRKLLLELAKIPETSTFDISFIQFIFDKYGAKTRYEDWEIALFVLNKNGLVFFEDNEGKVMAITKYGRILARGFSES